MTNDTRPAHTIYVLREVAERVGIYALNAHERARLAQHYAAVTYGPDAVTYAHPDVYPV